MTNSDQGNIPEIDIYIYEMKEGMGGEDYHRTWSCHQSNHYYRGGKTNYLISHHPSLPVSARGRIDVMMFQCFHSLSHSFMTSQLFAPLFIIEFDVRGSLNRSEILLGF